MRLSRPNAWLAALLATSALLLGTQTASAQRAPDVRPGLWEMTLGGDIDAMIDGQIKEVEAELADMPPEQRAQMRAMMQNMIEEIRKPRRECVTKEEAGRLFEDIFDDGDCDRKLEWGAGGRGVITGRCSDGTTEKGELVVASDKQVSMRTTISAPGEPARTFTSENRWLSADCGSVKP